MCSNLPIKFSPCIRFIVILTSGNGLETSQSYEQIKRNYPVKYFQLNFACAQSFLTLANVFYTQIIASGDLLSQRREVVVRRDRHCFCGVIAIWNDEISYEKHEEIRRLSSSLIVRYPRVFEPLVFPSNLVEGHVKKGKIAGSWAETVDIFSCASLLKRPICTFSSSQKKMVQL